MKQGTDTGLQTVERLYTMLSIDAEWSEYTGRGFIWWGQEYAQRVWAEETRMSEDLHVTRVVAETDFLRKTRSPVTPLNGVERFFLGSCRRPAFTGSPRKKGPAG